MATPTVSTSVTELPESRVRVEAQVPPEEVEKSIAQAARGARPQHARARLPRRQGAGPRGDQAGGARCRARRGGAGLDRVLVHRRDRRRRDRPGRRARPRHGRASRPRPAADVLDRDRRPPGGEARRLQGARGRQARARLLRRGGRGRGREGPRARRTARDRGPRGGRGRLRRDGLQGHPRRRGVRRRRGPRPDDRARLRPARARVRGAAHRRERRRGAHRRR